jgi:GNAT superfamily N-acetyltransferase
MKMRKNMGYRGRKFGMEKMKISPAKTTEEIRKCFPVVHQLRPHLNEDAFVSQVQRQMENHEYCLIFIEENGAVKAAAGYRIAEFLAWGRTLYVDDLITSEGDRGKGCGGELLNWLQNEAKEMGCTEFHLDSGVHRFDAHRLYLVNKMNISGHHFSKKVG